MTSKLSQGNQNTTLLTGFNNREGDAFGRVYEMYYTELIYFAKQLYRETDVVAADIVHDIFIKLWKNKTIQFQNFIGIKAYIIISVKNEFLDYVKHKKHIRKFQDEVYATPDYFMTEIIESETLSLLSEAIKVLPEEMAKVFRLYLDGWDIKEIADKLGKTTSTVYAQKRDAINLLKNRFTGNKLIIMQIFLGL